MKHLVVVTRPAEDAGETVAAVRALGFEALEAPSLTIEDTGQALPVSSLYSALMFTSSNGVRAFLRRKPGQDYFARPAYAVGDRTAALLREAGFQRVYSASGNLADMAAQIFETLPPGRIAHFRGRDVSDDASSYFQGLGDWRIDGIILYQADAVSRIDEAVLRHLKNGEVSAVLFYSARSAEAFVTALVKAWPEAILSKTKALCIADRVVESLGGLTWADIRVAARPDQAGMMSLLAAL